MKVVSATEIMRKLFQILSRMGSRYFLFYDISSELCQFHDRALLYLKHKVQFLFSSHMCFNCRKDHQVHRITEQFGLEGTF